MKGQGWAVCRQREGKRQRSTGGGDFEGVCEAG